MLSIKVALVLVMRVGLVIVGTKSYSRFKSIKLWVLLCTADFKKS